MALGGIILKKTLVMLADSGPEGTRLLDRVCGGILFGVPNHGMDQEALSTAVRGQPNQALSLAELEKSFSGVGSIYRMSFHWGYETVETRTVSIRHDGSLAREGPWSVLVSRESATRGLFGSDFKNTFAINKDHSDMVKYSYKDPICEEVLTRLHKICAGSKASTARDELWSHRATGQMLGPGPYHGQDREESGRSWIQDLMETLFVPEMDGRFATIEDNSTKTFEWIFDPAETNFVNWLTHGKGLFWIQGKPGSGKSTLMRFISKDDRTEFHLEGQDLISRPREVIKTRHFFHSRGTVLQKSFEGLLRSILFQILGKAPQLSDCIKQVFQEMLTRKSKSLWTSSNLRKCLNHILGQSTYDFSLFILLDALDEFDGTPKHISDFLEDLLRFSGDKTRIQILFSSRPWETFQERFESSEGLRLQEHNKVDIETYCKNAIFDQDTEMRPLLHPLIPEIVRRAEGVFIWVKFTLEGLIQAANSGKDAAELVTALESIPTDLVEYYTSVIRRIKHEDRLDAYVLFQLLVSRTEGRSRIDSMDVLFAHSVWKSKTLEEAQTSFNALMSSWVHDTFASRWQAGTTLNQAHQRTFRFVRNRLMINRYGIPDQFKKQKEKISRLSGGLAHVVKAPLSSQSKDMLQVHLDEMVEINLIPRRTALGLKPLCTSFTEEDQEPFWVEPSHQTVYEFIKRPEFKNLILGKEADFFHENRYTWVTKTLFAQGLLGDAGFTCLLSELTTGRSMVNFIDSIPKTVWKSMYDQDVHNAMDTPEAVIDSPLRFAVFNGLTLYLKDAIDLDKELIRTTKEELILIAPLGFARWKETLPDGRWKLVTSGPVFLDRYLDSTRQVVEGGYNPQKIRSAYLKIMWIIGALTTPDSIYINRGHTYEDRWPALAAEAKAALLIELGQDPNVRLSGVRMRFLDSKWNTDVQWRPLHVSGLAFTKTLHKAGADLNGEDGRGNTPLDWLLAPWDTAKSRKLRGLAHRLTEDVDGDVQRNRWGKIAYLIDNGGVARTTTARVWQAFISRHHERLAEQSVTIVRKADLLGRGRKDSKLSLGVTPSQDTGGDFQASLRGTTLHEPTFTGFSDVVTRTEAGEVVTYTNLGDDENLLESHFQDLELAQNHLAGLPMDNRQPEAKKGRGMFLWRSRNGDLAPE
ncbi:hypothetical protein N0V82_008943 [Gnomoniopsis sp. IMI 355080]|nr:hypothetical protein N0V82_008943 [Gnomoniopsis sp. IMI 355080]